MAVCKTTDTAWNAFYYSWACDSYLKDIFVNMLAYIYLSITVNFCFRRFQRHVHTYRILPDADGLLAVQVSVRNTTHTHHWQGKQGKSHSCGQRLRKQQHFQLHPFAFLPQGCVFVAQALQHRGEIVFMSQRFLVNPHTGSQPTERARLLLCVCTQGCLC